jgi:asparagine synthase (glutamine-hydrolysing)
MAHGVEGRVPLLDPAVAAAAFPLPDRFKVNKGVGKYVLRKWLHEHLPEAAPFSKKRGFTVPVGEWIAGRGEQLGALVASSPGIEEICRPEGVTKVFRSSGKREGFAAWTLLFYALWYRRHILGQLPEGDTFEYLSAAP